MIVCQADRKEAPKSAVTTSKGKDYESGLLGSSIKNTTTETLFLELALRGYDLSRLRDENETTGEVVKIS